MPRGAVGFSLGGNALLKLLGELGDDAAGHRTVLSHYGAPFLDQIPHRHLAIGERVRVGQTVRLHVRDAASADQDLREALSTQAQALGSLSVRAHPSILRASHS